MAVKHEHNKDGKIKRKNLLSILNVCIIYATATFAISA